MYDPKPETHWYGRYNGSGIAASLPVLLGGLGLFSDTVSSGSSTPDLLSACIGSAILSKDECVERNILNRTTNYYVNEDGMRRQLRGNDGLM